MVNPTRYYDSTARKRRYGTWCDDCKKEIEVGEKCKRAQGERNSFGCMTYYESCLKCWKRLLPKSVQKAEKELEEYIKTKQKQIEKLRKMVNGI